MTTVQLTKNEVGLLMYALSTTMTRLEKMLDYESVDADQEGTYMFNKTMDEIEALLKKIMDQHKETLDKSK